MGEENIAVRQHHRIADLSSASRIFILPDDFPLPHDKDLSVVRFTRIEKIVLR
jgi:hypothetical protein